jgi:hypothetical protein
MAPRLSHLTDDGSCEVVGPSCTLSFSSDGQLWSCCSQNVEAKASEDREVFRSVVGAVAGGTFAQDACGVRNRNAPKNLAHLRDAALNLIRRRKRSPKPARVAFAHNPMAAIHAVIQSQIELPWGAWWHQP